MRTFFEMTPTPGHSHGNRLAAAVSARLRACDPRRQDGFLLIEVMVSALLVALIVTATFNGLDVATRITAEQRHRDQAALLAAQSQEQLRSEPATALDALETNPHKYSTKVGGTTTRSPRKPRRSALRQHDRLQRHRIDGPDRRQHPDHLESQLAPAGSSGQRPEVKQASVISPPTGSAIEVDVINGEGTGVAGVTAKAEFIPNEAGSYNTVEGTTSSAGCIVLTGIQATRPRSRSSKGRLRDSLRAPRKSRPRN